MPDNSNASARPVANITEFEVGADRDLLLAHHDAVSAAAGIEDATPPGLILHAVGFDQAGAFLVIDVWESAGDARAFEEGPLAVALEAIPVALAAPAGQRSTSFELDRVARRTA